MSLYCVVEEYASLGDHRAGTPVDQDTIDWFCGRLERCGGKVATSGFDIAVYRSAWRVTIDDEEVPSIPLFYEGVGRYHTTAVCRDVLNVESYAAVFYDLPVIIERARASTDEALIIATRCANESIYAINRTPVLASGLPTMLVPGRVSENLAHARIELELHALIEPGRSHNVVASFGAGDGPPVVITTPLSGWFACAGERGTGIALALSLAETLAEVTPVMLVATSAHELDYAGGWEYTKTLGYRPRLVVHLGSSVAASQRPPCDGVAELTSGLGFRTHLGGDEHKRVGDVMSRLGLTIEAVEQPDDPHAWFGESSCWAHVGAPMLSFAGDFPLFHTPQDTAEQASAPALLERVDGVLTEAVKTVLS